MISLLYLELAFNLRDEDLVARWSENLLRQFFSGCVYFEHRLPCDAPQLGRYRRALGEDGLEELLKATIDPCDDSSWRLGFWLLRHVVHAYGRSAFKTQRGGRLTDPSRSRGHG